MGQEQSSPEQQHEEVEHDGTLGSATEALSALMGEGEDLPPHDLDAEAEQSGTEAESEEAKQPESKQEAEKPADEAKAPKAITLKIGDKEYSIPVPDETPEEIQNLVKDGLLMRADYSRKTMEVAEQRKAVETQAAAMQQGFAILQALPDHLAAIKGVEAQLAQFQNPELWQRLAAEDPSGIRTIQAKQAFQDLSNQRQALYGEVGRLQSQMGQQMREQAEKRMQAALPLVKSAIPDYSKEKVAEMREYAHSMGVTDEQLDSIYDAAPLIILHKAMLYDKLQGDAKDVTKKVEKLPPKVVRSGTSQGPQSGPQLNQAAMQRLRSSGKTEDAAAAIKSLLG